MKKFVIAVIITFFHVSLFHAQDIYVGPKVGINLTHVMYDGSGESFYNNNQIQLSSHFGVFTEFILSDYISLQPELLYSVKGAQFDLAGEDFYRSSYIYKYLSLPLIIKYYVTEEITVEVGPQVAYLLSAKNVETSEIFVTGLGREAASIDIKGNMQEYDLGVTAGIGYLTKSGFYISARYNLGMMNTFKDDPDITDTLKNGAAQLSFGFSFQ